MQDGRKGGREEGRLVRASVSVSVSVGKNCVGSAAKINLGALHLPHRLPTGSSVV